MFEECFPAAGGCQLVSEDVQEIPGGLLAATVTFRVLDDAQWMAQLPALLVAATPYAADFSWVVRKEFYVEPGTTSVRFIWVVFVWATGGVGLGMAARTWAAHLRAAPLRRAQTSRPEAPRAAPKAAPAAAREDATQLRPSTRLRTTVLGTEANGVVRSATTVRLGRREAGRLLYVVADPRQRTVKATRPAVGDSADSARAGLSGRPRVHVENIAGDDGGVPAATEDL